MHVDGFRFDLAPALARELHEVDRLSRVLRAGPAGPGAVAGEADRRAVGRRHGRLPGGRVPAAVGGVERASTATRCGTSGAADRPQLPEFASRLSRLERPLQASGAPARAPRSTSSPATTASPCATWSATTASTTRPTARTTATAPTTTGPGTAAPRDRRDDPAITALRAGRCATSWSPLFCSQGVPMLLAGDEIGRTPARQQQRVLPGQRDVVGGLGAVAGAAGSCSASSAPHRAAPRAPGVPPPHVLRPAAPRDPGGPADVVWFLPAGRR